MTPERFAYHLKTACKRVHETLPPTPCELIPSLGSHNNGKPVYGKIEAFQPTGAFKVRGALNKLLGLKESGNLRGEVIAVSTGNHGRAVAWVGARLGVKVNVYLSVNVPPNKCKALEDLGAKLHRTGDSYDEAFEAAKEMAEASGFPLVPPFDDLDIIAGQGTIGAELAEQIPDADSIVVPLSGGGLIAGIALAAKSHNPTVRIIGVSMRAGAAMAASIDAGKPVQVPELNTVADSLKGGIGLENKYTFSAVRDYVDDIILLDEKDIKRGMAHALKNEQLVLEGAAATPIALLLTKTNMELGKTVLILSGKNVDTTYFLEQVQPFLD